VFEIEENLMLGAHVVRPIVDRGAIRSRRLHHVDHHSRNIYLVSSWKGLPVSCLVVCVSFDSCGVFIFLLVKEGGDSVLSSELLPRLFGKVVDNFSSESNAGHCVQNDFIGDHVTHTQHFTI
jgi:hypothetical protein